MEKKTKIQKKSDEEKKEKNEESHYIRFVQLVTGLQVTKMTGKEVPNSDPASIRYTIEYKTDDNGNLTYPYKYDDEKDLLPDKYWTKEAAISPKNELNKRYSQLLHSLTLTMRAGGDVGAGSAVYDMGHLVEGFNAVIKSKELTFPTFTYDPSLVGGDNKEDEKDQSK